MSRVYQSLRILKFQILSNISNDGFVPGFFISLVLAMLLFLMLVPTPQKYFDTTRLMTAVYSLLVVGVLWKFINYMREKS